MASRGVPVALSFFVAEPEGGLMLMESGSQAQALFNADRRCGSDDLAARPIWGELGRTRPDAD